MICGQALGESVRKAEIDQLDAKVFINSNVLSFDVTMRKSLALQVQRRLEDLPDYRAADLTAERLLSDKVVQAPVWRILLNNAGHAILPAIRRPLQSELLTGGEHTDYVFMLAAFLQCFLFDFLQL